MSKTDDHGFDVHYSSKGSHTKEEKPQEKTALRRELGVLVLDTWVVSFEMAKIGVVRYKDGQGKTGWLGGSQLAVGVSPSAFRRRVG